MNLMTTSTKYQASNKDIIASYSRFFQALLATGYDTWQDYVLDQILLGRDNAFARAVAQVSVSVTCLKGTTAGCNVVYYFN